MKREKDYDYICSICRKKCSGFGNNPRPLVGKKCCNTCNSKYVIPVRTIMMR